MRTAGVPCSCTISSTNRGTVGLVGAGSDWGVQPGNGLYVELDGDRPDAVRFKPGVLVSRRTLRFRRGTYELSFRLAGLQRRDANPVDVRPGDVHGERITLASGGPFQHYVRTIHVFRPREARLSFDAEGADGYGLLLHGVRLLRRVR